MDALMQILCAGFGGAFGAMLRFALSKNFDSAALPWGTLAANTAASFFLGIAPILARGDGLANLFFSAGFCAALSTFSSLAWQIYAMIRRGRVLKGAMYAALTVVAGMCAYALAAAAAGIL